MSLNPPPADATDVRLLFSWQGLQGTLFKYGPGPSHVAMMTGRHSRHLVLVGGLTDGLLALPYAPQLHRRLDEASWSCVQCQLTSSYQARARRRRPPWPPLPRTRWPRSNRPTGAVRVPHPARTSPAVCAACAGLGHGLSGPGR